MIWKIGMTRISLGNLILHRKSQKTATYSSVIPTRASREKQYRRFKMNQPIPNGPQEAWLAMLGKGHVIFPEGWWDELGMQNGMFVKAKKEGELPLQITAEPDLAI
jgi:hypothetical protein